MSVTLPSDSVVMALMAAVQRVGVQLRRARGTRSRQKSRDLAREAVSRNAVLGGGSQLALQLNSCMVDRIGSIAVHLFSLLL
jgi:hypothetical protein